MAQITNEIKTALLGLSKHNISEWGSELNSELDKLTVFDNADTVNEIIDRCNGKITKISDEVNKLKSTLLKY